MWRSTNSLINRMAFWVEMHSWTNQLFGIVEDLQQIKFFVMAGEDLYTCNVKRTHVFFGDPLFNDVTIGPACMFFRIHFRLGSWVMCGVGSCHGPFFLYSAVSINMNVGGHYC